MHALGGIELGPSSFPPFAVFRETFGFVPNLFCAQSLLPRALEAEAALTVSVLAGEQALSRVRKERILLAVSAANRNTYCVTAHYQNLFLLGVPETQLAQIIADYRQADLSPADRALLDFSVKLGASPSIAQHDIAGIRANGWNDQSILEAVLITAWTRFLCTLACGLGVEPDFEPIEIPAATTIPWSGAGKPAPAVDRRPYMRAVERTPDEFAPFCYLREELGFVPDIFRAQTLRPDVVEAEVGAIRMVLLSEDVLTRRQKEYIQLVVSAANRNSYWVDLHCEILRAMGVSLEDADQIAADHRQAQLPDADKSLLDLALKLALAPCEFQRADLEPFRHGGFTEEQILEAVVTTSFATFFNTLQVGLGAKPDFPPRPVPQSISSKTVHLLDANLRPTGQGPLVDPDAESVARVQGGDLDAFEDLMNRHSRRIYRTLVGILGDPEEARDAMQDAFFKAFRHLGDFQGRSKFSTWLVSIASNTGLQLLRERKRLQSLDDDRFESEEGFRPKELRSWADDPEQLYSKAEIQELVEDTVMKLPAKYRVVLVLRDIEQLPAEEAAAALGLGIPALKARLLRGRLMVREALSPRFANVVKGGGA